MATTPYYNLQKPASEDKYNISVANMNMDLIDSALNRIATQSSSVEIESISSTDIQKLFNN